MTTNAHTRAELVDYFRTLEADGNRSAKLRGFAKQVADAVATGHQDQVVRAMRAVLDDPTNDAADHVAALFALGALAIRAPNFPMIY